MSKPKDSDTSELKKSEESNGSVYANELQNGSEKEELTNV